MQAETKETPRESGVHDHNVRGEGTSDDIELESICGYDINPPCMLTMARVVRSRVEREPRQKGAEE